MIYFKKDSEVFAFETIEAQQTYQPDAVQMTAEEVEAHLAPTTEQAKAKALIDFNNAVDVLTDNAPERESASWGKQELEARNLNSQTPLIDGLIVSRGLGEASEELAAKIIANADAYATAYAQVLGEYQAKLKALEP